MKGTLGAIAEWIPKSKIDKISSENQCFFAYFPNEGHAGSGHQMYPEEQNLQNMFGK